MQNQRGFVGVGVLIAIILAVVVLGGGAYYFVQQQAPTQTATENFDNVQTLPTTNTQTSPVQKTQTNTNTQTQITNQASNTSQATFSANPSSGPASLKVRFTSNKYATHDASESQHYVDFGDGTERGRIICLNSTGTDLGSYQCLVWGVEHVYASGGTYTAKLIEVAGCSTPNNCATRPEQTLRTSIITVSGNASTDLKTYTNSQHGFSVQYPADVSYSLANPGRFLNGSVSFSVNTGQSSSVRLDMGFPLPAERCDVPKTDASHTAPTDLRYESIGGISFAVYTNTSAPASANYIEKIYQGLRGSDCFFFVETITSASMSERTQLETKLDAVARAFRLTQ